MEGKVSKLQIFINFQFKNHLKSFLALETKYEQNITSYIPLNNKIIRKITSKIWRNISEVIFYERFVL